MSQVADALAAWRAALRRLAAESDPDQRTALQVEVDILHQQYLAIVGDDDVSAHARRIPTDGRTAARPLDLAALQR